ncbi:Cytochrome c-type biogenesis protein CcmG/DsbE, thiol:disulfide oxidoreductase [hydrothermal vent metagenome]|uniref:Cytochrome c-type biogenesis protein CcmG/DsbE, thiol:disulfide oxidoreductase n=1 Tax=hydrothermal vent metagenome TaxID=652676 RepID=A0A3B1AYX0_9ZZZZ
MSGQTRHLIPLFVFLIMAGFLLKGLFMDPKFIPSVLVNKPVPEFNLPRLLVPEQTISNADLKGKVWMLNVWASWCVACRAEHPVLNEIARMKIVDIYGLNYKDAQWDAENWLKRLGDPYVANMVDKDGRIGIDFGVYGVPESFIIDGEGIIRHKFTGPINYDDIEKVIIPKLNEIRSKGQ